MLFFHIQNNVVKASGYPWYVQRIIDRESIKAKTWNPGNMELFLCFLPGVFGVLNCLDLWEKCNNPYVYTNDILHNISFVTIWISVYYYGLNSMQIQLLMKDNIACEVLIFF